MADTGLYEWLGIEHRDLTEDEAQEVIHYTRSNKNSYAGYLRYTLRDKRPGEGAVYGPFDDTDYDREKINTLRNAMGTVRDKLGWETGTDPETGRRLRAYKTVVEERNDGLYLNIVRLNNNAK